MPIGKFLIDVLRAKEDSERQTGRTTSIITKAYNGDLIVAFDEMNANGIRDRLDFFDKRGIDVVSISRLFTMRGKRYNNIHIDPTSEYVYYLRVLEQAEKELQDRINSIVKK